MIWVHCGDKDEVSSTLSLTKRLLEYGDGIPVVVTSDAGLLTHFEDASFDAKCVAVPADTSSRARAFLNDWSPEYLIWNGGAVRPALLREVGKSSLPAVLINARNDTLFAGSSRWRPGATRNAVMPFNRILTADGATATRLTRGGVAYEKVIASGPILEEPMPPPHDQNELTVQVEALGARPVWFAADVVPSEVIHMAAAHLAASRKSHRLLMLITPRDINSGAEVAEILRSSGLKVGIRSEGDEPAAEQQAYVADLEGELGLWYRIAPLTFMGGTLREGGAISPFEPISLGSAVIHGPRKAPFATRFARLASAEASREIRSAAELGIAVGTLISPEQTARMALAGWTEITRNAEVINRLVLEAVEGKPTMEPTP